MSLRDTRPEGSGATMRHRALSQQERSDETLEFLGVTFNNWDVAEACAWVMRRPKGAPFTYVITPNVDIVLNMLGCDPVANPPGACVCDSRILSALARIAGLRLKVCPGSDLVPAVLAALEPGDTICFIAANARLAGELAERLPHLRIAHHVPPMGLHQDERGLEAAVRFIEDNPARVTLIGIGSPQKEVLAQHVSAGGLGTGTALCIGAAVEFYLGASKRAPRWMQGLGLEWAYRLICNPRRMAYRYLVRGPRIFLIFAEWLLRRKRPT